MKLPFTCAVLLLAPAFALAAADVRYEQGKAWNPDKTRLLYTESHWTSYENDVLKERTVLYSCADGTPFARKEMPEQGEECGKEDETSKRLQHLAGGLRQFRSHPFCKRIAQ